MSLEISVKNPHEIIQQCLEDVSRIYKHNLESQKLRIIVIRNKSYVYTQRMNFHRINIE